MEKISAVYKIVNTVTGDCYVGSSKNVKKRWESHKVPSTWKQHPNSPLYLDMQKYGLDKFRFQILAQVMPEYLKQVEQEFIDLLTPTYNKLNAKGWDIERYKEYQQSDKGKESRRKAHRKYNNQLCSYNGEELTLPALAMRLKKAGIEHPNSEAKKYLIK
jgi:group I intron endonuclease